MKPLKYEIEDLLRLSFRRGLTRGDRRCILWSIKAVKDFRRSIRKLMSQIAYPE